MASRNRKIPTKVGKKSAVQRSTNTGEAPVALKPTSSRSETTREESQRVALGRIANVVFGDNKVPDQVQQLITNITIEDGELIWELKSFVNSEGTLVEVNEMKDFISAVIKERIKNLPEPGQRPAPEDSLVFLSPALSRAQLNEERRDSLLLRKATAVRGVYKCPKSTCGDDLISTIQIQNRSFDEPSTNIHTCAICGTTWTSV